MRKIKKRFKKVFQLPLKSKDFRSYLEMSFYEFMENAGMSEQQIDAMLEKLETITPEDAEKIMAEAAHAVIDQGVGNVKK